MALPAFVAARLLPSAGQQSIAISYLPDPQLQTRSSGVRRANMTGQTYRLTDGHRTVHGHCSAYYVGSRPYKKQHGQRRVDGQCAAFSKCDQWHNDGVAAASSDGGPLVIGGPPTVLFYFKSEAREGP